jgi:hypothetical protein
MASTPSTPILSRPPEPWYKRVVWPAPRYIALIVAGVIVIGGGAAYGISHLVSDNGGNGGQAAATTQQNATTPAATKPKKKTVAPLDPSKITVAVLNGTSAPGLAAETINKLVQLGFQRGNKGNAPVQGQQAQSVVEYSANNSRAARLVANKLGISDIEPIDSNAQTVAGDATVTVILGADRAQTGTG